MVSRAEAKRGEQTHTPQLCNGGTIMYIELVNPSLWRKFLMLPLRRLQVRLRKAEQEQIILTIFKNTIMKTLSISTVQELKAFVNENRKSITNINGVEFSEFYPMLDISNKHSFIS